MSSSGIDPASVRAWQRHLGRDVDPAGLRRDLGSGTIASLASASARRVPDREAVRVGDRWLTHAELDDRARRVAAWLREAGVSPGSRVLLAAPTSLDFVAAYLGILHAGAAATFANPMLTAAELERVLEDARPTVAFAAGERVEQLHDLRAAAGAPEHVVTLDDEGPESLAEAVTGHAPLPVRDGDPDEVAHLAFTSGTTGRPKPTPLTHRNLLASIRSVMFAWRWTGHDVLVHSLPLTHGHGLSGVQAIVVSGCRGVLLQSFDPQRLCGAIAEHGGTVLFAVPAIWERLLDWDGFSGADLGSLRFATSGSAPLTPATSDAVAEVLGHRPLERYGCTETGYTLSNPYDGERKPGKVGFPLPGAEVLVVDRGGDPVEAGQDGEIVARGPQVFGGYEGVGNEDTFLPGGWFRTGDVGRVDPDDGYVAITGRAKDLIITGGLNVYPREVEIVLEAQPDVAAAAVVGAPSERWGEEVTAFVVPSVAHTLDTADLDRRLRRELAAYKCPKRVHVVDDLPRNHMGKVLRAELVRRSLLTRGD